LSRRPELVVYPERSRSEGGRKAIPGNVMLGLFVKL